MNNWIGDNNPRWNGGPAKRICEQCSTEFVLLRPSKKGRFCKQACYWENLKGKPATAAQLKSLEKGHGWSKGKTIPNWQAENNPNWKGDGVGYQGLHLWVYKHLGKPDTCEHCGTSGLSGLKINWANKSQQYKRDLSDWIRLCVMCHKKYDNQFGTNWSTVLKRNRAQTL